jgi:DnaJ-class molecular chaperone
MESNEAAKILGLTLPVAEGVLKSTFKRKAHETHPDLGGTDKDFIAVKNAYDCLLSSAFVMMEDAPKSAMTTTGELLSTLGKGIGHNKAGCKCEICSGFGYKEEEQVSFYDIYEVLMGRMKSVMCDRCHGDGFITGKLVPCRRCGAMGRYKVNGVDRGECRGCGGSGQFYLKFKFPARCQKCNGEGYVENKPVKKKIYIKCLECKGTGEIEMFNPVIPRFRI